MRIGTNELLIILVVVLLIFRPKNLPTLGKITAVGLGTVLAMLFVGRAISLVNHFFKEKMCRAAGMA